MTDKEILEKIRKEAREAFGVPINKLPMEASRRTLPEWDSLGHLKLLLEIEESFNVRFSMSEAQEASSFRAIQMLIIKKLTHGQ